MSKLTVALFLIPLGLSACTGEAEEQEQPKTASIEVVPGSSQPVKPPPVRGGSCSSIKIVNVVGQPYSTAVAEQARQASGAKTLKIAKPGGAADARADGDRLTLELNANETIVDARCG